MGEIRTYSADELMGSSLPVLPGWRYPGTLPIILEKPYRWNPVLSVSVFRDKPNTPGEIEALTLIRGHSTTHEDVVSMLTGQIPTEQVAPFLRRRALRGGEISTGNDRNGWAKSTGNGCSCHLLAMCGRRP